MSVRDILLQNLLLPVHILSLEYSNISSIFFGIVDHYSIDNIIVSR